MTISFTLPPGSEAQRPPEHRGLRRDAVRLLVARRDGIEHLRFRDLPDLLQPGDLLVVNTSATLPAALDGVLGDGNHAPVHVSTTLDDGDWVIEVRLGDGSGPDLSLHPGEQLRLPGGITLTLVEPHPNARLWRAAVTPKVSAQSYLPTYGRPISYSYLAEHFPLRDYQTVYATEPGSAEMASAGRPFTERLLVRLIARGIIVAPIVLHAGVSSPEPHEPPSPERFTVPAPTAQLVEMVRAAGQRVVAVGTTVVRALESAAEPNGAMHPATGWTDLVLGPDNPPRVVTGLITGLHAPQASHLLLLTAVAGRPLVETAYEAAVEHHYLWHEFGDSTLFLP